MAWLDDYLDAFSATVSASDAGGWTPFDPYTIYPYLAQQWLDRLWAAFETAKQKSLGANELAKGFLGSLAPREEISVIIFMAKSCNYDKEKTMKILEWLNEILCAKATEDPYGLNSNKIHANEDVKQMQTLLPFHQVDILQAKEIGKLTHACRELSYGLYTDYNFFQWFDTFGPYPAGENRQLLLHAFTNFAPTELFPQYSEFNPNNVYIYAIYEGAEIKLDQWSHPTSSGSLPQKMKKAFILSHTKIIEKPQDLIALRETMENAAVSQGKWVKSLDFEAQKQWELQTHCYMWRDFFNILGLNWKPTAEMMDAVKGKPLLNANYPKFETLEEKKQFWKKLFDPRNDFFLEGLKQ